MDDANAEVIWSAKTLLWGTVIIALLIGVLLVIYKAKRATSPAEYEGRIVNKWAGYTHSVMGSSPYFKLLVETGNGQRLTVTVEQDLYNRAKVGTWIKKTQTGVELGREQNKKAQKKNPLITLSNTNKTFVEFHLIRG
jgi:hypothetical protein